MGTDAQILCDYWRTKRTDTCTGECQRPDRAVWMEVNLFDKDLPTGATASILVHGADHAGRTLGPHITEALELLSRAVNPPGPDSDAVEFKQMLAPIKEKFGMK